MSADLHIHVLTGGFSEDDLAAFHSSTLGSKHFKLGRQHSTDRDMELFRKVGDTPDIWIGSVSWLKAALFEDSEAFIPNTVQKISELVGEDLPVVDDQLIEQIVAAFDTRNTTSYSLAEVGTVRAFLEEHKGERVFTVSW